MNGSEVHIDIYDDRMEIYSPGGMPDDSIIQDRDPLTVPSTRRNPVLADIFNRLPFTNVSNAFGWKKQNYIDYVIRLLGIQDSTSEELCNIFGNYVTVGD